MTDKNMRRLSRSELLEMLIAQSKENERLNVALEEATAKLSERDITIANAGSIAEASLQLNDVFLSAQKAADQYLENLRRLTGDRSAACAQIEAECKKRCEEMISAAEKECDRRKKEADDYWQELVARLRELRAQHPELFKKQ